MWVWGILALFDDWKIDLSSSAAPVQAGAALLYVGLASLVATLAASISPAGTDNLSVPLLTAATLYLLL